MKLFENNFPVQIEGADSGTSQFSIAMNAKAFRVLSDTLYQDKIGSLVREISTNAYDGHIMAGNVDEPFEIHLPDNFEPWFSVRDFGVGLSPQAVRQVFTTYFMSTKDQSNDTVGAFGLGAKTPFAYTDQFTIESNYAGMKTIYSAFIDGSGIPNIAEMHSEKTSDRRGVEIKVAVKQEDFNTFRVAVANQLKYFKVKPFIKNDSNFRFVEVVQPNEHSIVGVDYVVTPNRSELVVIQGQIGYPVNRDKILTTKVLNEHPEVAQLLQTAVSIRLEFPIGKIGVTASRENIEYDEQTVKNIIEKIVEIREDIQKNVEKSLAIAPNGWEKVIVLDSLFSHFKAPTKLNYPNLTSNYRQGYYFDLKPCKYQFWFVQKKWGTNVTTRIQAVTITPKANIGVVLVNISKPRSEVLFKLLDKCSELYIVFIEKDADVAKVKKDITEYLLGFDNFFIHADLVEKRVRQKSVVVNPKTTYFDITSPTDFGKSSEAELPDEFVYVETNRGNLQNYSQDKQLLDEFFLLKGLDEFKDEMQIDVLGIPVSEMKKLKGSGGVSLSDFLKEIKKDMSVEALAVKHRKFKLYQAATAFVGSCEGSIRQAVMEVDCEYGKMLSSCLALSAKYSKFSPYGTKLAEVFGIKSTTCFIDRAYKKAASLKSKHPVLKIATYNLVQIERESLKKLIAVTV